MDVSVIIPLFNESESLKELDDWISLSFKYKDLDEKDSCSFGD